MVIFFVKFESEIYFIPQYEDCIFFCDGVYAWAIFNNVCINAIALKKTVIVTRSAWWFKTQAS